jgi:hypothetical protein
MKIKYILFEKKKKKICKSNENDFILSIRDGINGGYENFVYYIILFVNVKPILK